MYAHITDCSQLSVVALQICKRHMQSKHANWARYKHQNDVSHVSNPMELWLFLPSILSRSHPFAQAIYHAHSHIHIYIYTHTYIHILKISLSLSPYHACFQAEALVSTMVANGAVLPRADDSIIVHPEPEHDVLMLKCALWCVFPVPLSPFFLSFSFSPFFVVLSFCL